jgi:hypothetical protein
MVEPDAGAYKVFCVGFHKTGTTSLARALTLMGYRVTGPNGVRDPEIGRRALPMALELVQRFDAFQDNPWPILFRELDQHFPGSKFILTLRKPEEWIQSLVRHFGEETTPMREWIYGGHGSPVGNEGIYLERYARHNADVLGHFRDRPADLLVMRITEGDGWDLLCPFLGKTVPDREFPHQNRAEVRERAGTDHGSPLANTGEGLRRLLGSLERGGR